MNETPTPRTDAAAYSFYIHLDGSHETEVKPDGSNVTADFARELERELSAATDKIETLEWSGVHTCGPECQRPLCVMRRERDAATAACAAMREALEVPEYSCEHRPCNCYGKNPAQVQPGYVCRKCRALSNPAGQDLLAELRVVRETCDEQSKIIMECANARDEWKAAWTALNDDTRRQLSTQSARIASMEELLREIRDGEVNPECGADKFLRDHQPSELSTARARIAELDGALEATAEKLAYLLAKEGPADPREDYSNQCIELQLARKALTAKGGSHD